MTRDNSDLATLVREARSAREMSIRDVVRASGSVMSSSTVHAIEQGQRTTVGPEILTGLSKALGIPMTQMRAAQGRHGRVPSQPFVLPPRASELTARQRRVVLEMVDVLLDAGRQ